MIKTKALTFREKEETLKEVFSQYNLAKFKLQCLEQHTFYPTIRYDTVREKRSQYGNSMITRLDDYIDSKNELEEIVNGFEMIIDQLCDDSRLIIVKEFVNSSNREWWTEYYSRSSYYRLKTRAMEEILFYLNV